MKPTLDEFTIERTTPERRLLAGAEMLQAAHAKRCRKHRCLTHSALWGTVDRARRDLEVAEGYAEVEYLFAIGADCCMGYQASGHDECVWHHDDKRAALIARAAQ